MRMSFLKGWRMTVACRNKTAGYRRRLPAAISVILLLCVFCNPCRLAAVEFYRWVDENGIVHVSDTFPQPSQTARKQEVRRFNVPVNVPAQGASQSDEYQIPFTRMSSGGILVKGVFDDFINVTLLFDTGASHVVISEALARQLDSSFPVSRKIKLHTAAGMLEARTSMISKVAVGDACKEKVPAVITERDNGPDGFDAILGLSFLEDFKTTVDYQNGVIILKRHR